MARQRRTDLDARDGVRGKRQRPTGRVFAFRADPAMVQALLEMPNASDFIRKAITRSLEEPCPVCIGTGVVATGFRSQLERLEGHLVLRRCSCCATEYPGFCADVTPRLKGADRLRWELEVKRGEFLCAPCLERSPPCDTCGRAMDKHAPDSFVAHFRVQRVGRALLIDPVLVDDGDDPSRPGRRRRAR
jgi:hypothetical protein